MPRQTSIQLTPATERQINSLQSAGYGTLTDVVRLAVDRMYQQEISVRKLVSRDGEWTIVGGPFTEEELAVASQIGYVNAYLRPLFEVVDEYQADAPPGWRVSANTDRSDIPPRPDAIRIGQIKPIHGDPAFPVFLYRE